MTLRVRLLLSLGGLVAVALVVAGALVVGFTRASLVEQVDDELRSASATGIGREGGGPGPRRGAGDPTGRRVAYVLVGPQGRIVASVPSGPAAEPDPLPSLPETDVLPSLVGRIAERPSVEGEPRYRVTAQPGPQGTWLVLGAPLNVVDQPIRALVRNLVVVGALVLAAVLLVTWLIVRRGLRPLETIATTADTIAAGDLSRRLALPHDGSEVGRLGSAFDSMLDQIEGAFDEQRRALEAKDASERRLRQFVADASHELRTPLTALRGYAELYRAGGLAEPDALDGAMARIGTESRRMGALVEDLLLLARLDQGRPLRRDHVDLSQLVTDAVADGRAVEPARPIEAKVEPGVRVVGDEDRLRQVVANLLANVRVHTPPGARVDVVLRAEGPRATIVVADRGPGVPPEHAGRVFDRFFRADPARSRDRGGSGLGLAIVASIVAAHGGSVAHHPTPGGGATFTVTLPVAAAPQGSTRVVA